jgi:hypothetical protein
VEGFVRQIFGWRESRRGVYWHTMPGSLERNPLAAHAPLPGLPWTGETEMRCLRECIGQTLRHGYAHPIQRLMVTALFALLHRPRPRRATALRGLAARTRDARFIAAAKGGVEALVRSLAIDYAAQGVRVNAIAPGLTRTPMSERMLSSEAAAKTISAQYPFGRAGEAAEAAALAALLISERAGWITGQVIGFDGGFGSIRPLLRP